MPASKKRKVEEIDDNANEMKIVVKKEKSKKKIRDGRTTRLINKGPLLLPDEYFCKYQYLCQYTLTSTNGAKNTYSLRGNSIYDPDYSGSGSSCVGVTELEQLYTRYLVYGCKYEVTWQGADNTPWQIAVVATTSGTAPTNVLRGSTNPYCKSNQGNCYVNPKRMVGYVSSNEIWGVPKSALAIEDSYSSGYTNNPASPWFIHFIAQPSDTTSTASGYLTVKMTFFVKNYQRQFL